MKFKLCVSKEEIESTYSVMKQLRPHIDFSEYYKRVSYLVNNEKYMLHAVFDDDDKCLGVVGYQFQNRLSLGSIIYLADLVVDEKYRSKGLGKELLDIVKQAATNKKADVIVLDSGLQRKLAHKFYRKNGYSEKSFSFRLFKPFTSKNETPQLKGENTMTLKT